MVFSKWIRWLGIELIEVSLAEKVVSAAGGGLSLWILLLLSHVYVPDAGAYAVVASMGASAVLLFAVPHGPLSQPWPVLAGHILSALIGVTCYRIIPHPETAAACAVGLSIGAMVQWKCVHPPGGATAFTAVMGGKAIHELGYQFVIFPVLINAAAMVLLAMAINSFFRWRKYPSIQTVPEPDSTETMTLQEVSPTHEEVLIALKSLDSFVDISEEDLVHLVRLLRHTSVKEPESSAKIRPS